jgi:hypothetical protein
MISKLIKAWNPFWFTPLDARPLALFRILTGILCFAMFASMLPNWSRFFAADGMISLVSVEFKNPRVDSCLGLFHWTEGWIPVEFFGYFSLVICGMFIFGMHTRWVTLALLLLIDATVHRNPYITNGEELVARMCLVYCLLVDLGAVWSWDALRRKERGLPDRKTVFSWPVRMMQINIALIYAISLPYKFAQDPGWVTGDAMHWTVASDMWGPSSMPWITLAFGGFFRKLITFGTVIVEGMFPLLVWFRPSRRLAIFLISSLHIGIALVIPNVTFFTLIMVCVFAAFWTGEDFDQLASFWKYLKSNYFTSNRNAVTQAQQS